MMSYTPESDKSITPVFDGDAFLSELAELTPPEFDRARKDAARKFGIRVETLDGMVRAARKGEVDVSARPFADVEPHPEPIDPAKLLSLTTVKPLTMPLRDCSASGRRHYTGATGPLVRGVLGSTSRDGVSARVQGVDVIG